MSKWIVVVAMALLLVGCAVKQVSLVKQAAMDPGYKAFETSLGNKILVPKEFPDEPWRLSKKMFEDLRPHVIEKPLMRIVSIIRFFIKSDGTKEWVNYVETYSLLDEKPLELCARNESDALVCVVANPDRRELFEWKPRVE